MQKDPEVANVFEYMLKIQYRAKICLTLLSPNYFNHLTYPPQIIMLPVLVLNKLDIHLKSPDFNHYKDVEAVHLQSSFVNL